jgi:hypothetical protein
VAVAAQRGPQRRPPHSGRQRLLQQPVQVGGPLAAGSLGDDPGGGRAYPGQLWQRAGSQPALELAGRKVLHHLGGPAERPHPVGRRLRAFQLKRDLPQRLDRTAAAVSDLGHRSLPGACPRPYPAAALAFQRATW